MDTTSTSPTDKSEDKEKRFNSEEVTAIIKETVESNLDETEYSHARVPVWNSTIIETCLSKLKALNKNYKYIVTCIILQKQGAGFYAGSSVYWDNQNDGTASYRHETRSLYAIVNVFALSV